MKILKYIFLCFIFIHQQVSVEFECKEFLNRYKNTYEQSFSIEMYCTQDNETFSILQIDQIKKNKKDTEKRQMMQSKIYKAHLVSTSVKNDENNNSIKMFCYDLETTFVIFNSGFFNCFPQPYEDENGYIDIDFIYKEFDEELREMVQHYLNQLRQYIDFTFDHVKYILTNLADKNNRPAMIIKDTQPVFIDSKLQYVNLNQKNVIPSSVNPNTLQLDGKEGTHFQFRFSSLPLYFYKCTIYYSSQTHIRVIIKSNNTQLDLYLKRFISREFDTDIGFAQQKIDNSLGKNKKTTISSIDYKIDEFDTIMLVGGPKIATFLQFFYQDDISVMGQIQKYEDQNPPIQRPYQARGILAAYQQKNLLNTPIVALMLYDFFVNSQEPDEKLNALATTHITYSFLVPIKNEENLGLDQLPTEEWFYLAHTQLQTDRVNNLGALYQYLSITSLQSKRNEINGDLSLNGTGQINKINEYIKDYFETRYNYFEFTIGLKEIMRKMVIRIYGYEDIFYPNIQVKIFTQYFVTEHIIPLTEYDTFMEEISKKIREAVDHYQDYVIELDRIDLNQQRVVVDDFRYFIGEFLKDKSFCIEESDDSNNVFYIKYKYNTEFKQDYEDDINCKRPDEDQYQAPNKANDLPKCSSDIMLKTAFTLKEAKIDEDNSVYILTMYEPKTASKKNPSQNSFQTFKEYQYNVLPMLRRQIRSQVCHLLTNEYSRRSVDKDLRHEIFTGKRPSGI